MSELRDFILENPKGTVPTWLAKKATAEDIILFSVHEMASEVDENMIIGNVQQMYVDNPDQYPNLQSYVLLYFMNEKDISIVNVLFRGNRKFVFAEPDPIIGELWEIIHNKFLYGSTICTALLRLGLRDDILTDAVEQVKQGGHPTKSANSI